MCSRVNETVKLEDWPTSRIDIEPIFFAIVLNRFANEIVENSPEQGRGGDKTK